MAERFPSLTAKEVELAVKSILGSVAMSMSEGKRVEIRGFGSFDLNYRPARVGRNPKTGKRVDVPEKYVPHFKAGKELRDRVDSRH
ncbi:MAG: integration host factor subunit beta [Neisseriaceae bacterium]|nr:integration host factor subunit beta [Neisseriaceae bacterium]